MSNRNTNNKLNPNVEVVLPAGGSNPTVTSGTVSTSGNQKQDLKNQLATLKAQQKETAKNIKAAQKELSKLSKPAVVKKKQEVQIVKKKNPKKLNGKK